MIISDRESQFVARFWEQLHASLGTHLIHSLAYHPQTDGQTERVNQIIEDMLRACVMEYSGSWDKNLPWAEFLYNNNYQESLKMAPFEAPRSTGSSQERKLYLAQTLLLRLKQRYVVSKKT
jgi:transposase InsO family protein